jgi:hypothetical protein
MTKPITLALLLILLAMMSCEQPQVRLTINSPDSFADLVLSVDYRTQAKVESLPLGTRTGYVPIAPLTPFTIDVVGCREQPSEVDDVGEGEGEVEPGQSADSADCRRGPERMVQRGCTDVIVLERGEEREVTIDLFAPPPDDCPKPLQ